MFPKSLMFMVRLMRLAARSPISASTPPTIPRTTNTTARTATLSEKETYPTGITAYKSNSRKNVTAHKTLPSNQPIAPATVFFGDIDGQSFLFPKVLPTRYANVSENTGRKIANDIANVPPHGNSLDSANASDTSAIG